MRQRVCVQGLGFVGSAMATAIAIAEDEGGNPWFDVLGVDLPTDAGLQRVQAINDGRFPFETTDATLPASVAKARARDNLRATTDAAAYAAADIIVVDVHLDIPFQDETPVLEFAAFEKAIRAIGERMRANALMIVETTVPPGTCEKVVAPTLKQCFRERGLDPEAILLAHSYERVMPGADYLDSIIHFWRVFSGYTPEAAAACEAFLSRVIDVARYPLTQLGSTTASETAKVLENSYRAVNIAFVCEWTRYAEQVGIDLYEVVRAIQQRPTHANLRYPGLGIGGYCLTKDPAFAPAAARQLFQRDLDFPFSELAIREATRMPLHGVARLRRLLGGEFAGRRILLCGVSYRQDVADTRYSPAEVVYRELQSQGAVIDCHDPFVGWWEEVGFQVPRELPPSNTYDAVLFAIPHSQYQQLDLVAWIEQPQRTRVLDAYLVFSAEQRRHFRQHGIHIEAIGVGDGL